MIYKHVFDDDAIVIGPVNKKTFTRIYTIDQSQHQYDLALLGTCRSLRAEVMKYLNPRSIIRNISASTVVSHMHGDPRSLNRMLHEVELLRKVIKLWVRLGMQRSGHFKRFEPVSPSADKALSLTFVDEQEPVGTSGIADRGWLWLLETFVARPERREQ